MAIRSETELYAPVKAFLERLGYEVRGEVRHCDVVAIRGDEEPVIVELKKTFNLPLLIQGLDRLVHTDKVYLAFEKNESGRAPHQLAWSDLVRLCRRLGLGLMTVRFYKRKAPNVEVLCDPATYTPRKNAKRTAALLEEFRERSGDYNVGGSTRTKLMTAYREKALHLAYHLQRCGPLSTRELRKLTGNPKTTDMLQDNYYSWYRRVKRGTYELTPQGVQALEQYGHVSEGFAAAEEVTADASSAGDGERDSIEREAVTDGNRRSRGRKSRSSKSPN